MPYGDVNCSTYTNYYTYNPISNAVPTGAWKYFYFVCGSSTEELEFTSLPSNTRIYITVAAPGGLGVSSGGGGGGGNIVTYSILSNNIIDGPNDTEININIDAIDITLEPISKEGVNISILQLNSLGQPGQPVVIFLEQGSNASGNAGGNGASVSYTPPTLGGILKKHTDGLGGDGNPKGKPYFSPTVKFEMPDKTTASVVSGGGLGLSGNSSWAMVYYQHS
jgi:hypothetical protein